MLLLALGALTAVVLVISHPMMEHEVSHFDMDLEYQQVQKTLYDSAQGRAMYGSDSASTWGAHHAVPKDAVSMYTAIKKMVPHQASAVSKQVAAEEAAAARGAEGKKAAENAAAKKPA